jgi:thiol:disulfide interchange protein DsbD
MVGGMAFCGGIVLFFAVFALLSAVIHKTTGTFLDLNSLFRYANAAIVLFLAIVFFGLMMLDVVTLSLPSFVTGHQGSGSGMAGSLGMGFFAGILSTPCSGALLGFVLFWAQTQPLKVSTLAIILMGIGMALPYAILVSIPSLLDRIPKPGTWMELFKKSTGFLLFLIAVEITLTALPKERLINVLLYGVVFSFCVWMWGKWVDFSTPARKKWTVRLTAVVLAVWSGLWLLPSAPEPLISWVDYDSDIIATAINKKQPVLIKFTADWCTNCKVVDKRVYQDPDMIHLIKQKGVLAVKADTTLNDASAYKDLKAVYGEPGNVPVTIVLLADQRQEKLRGIFSKETLYNILDPLKDAEN